MVGLPCFLWSERCFLHLFFLICAHFLELDLKFSTQLVFVFGQNSVGFVLVWVLVAFVEMGKVENRSFHRLRLRFGVYGFAVMSLLFQSFHLCWSLNEEGKWDGFSCTGLMALAIKLFLIFCFWWKFRGGVWRVFWVDLYGFIWAGLTLLKFRERVVNDPFGALSNWDDHKEDINPCFWLGVECSDGKVIALYVVPCFVLSLSLSCFFSPSLMFLEFGTWLWKTSIYYA